MCVHIEKETRLAVAIQSSEKKVNKVKNQYCSKKAV